MKDFCCSSFTLLFVLGRWGVLHTEKFWRENAKFLEKDNFSLMKALIALLSSNEKVGLIVTLSICHVLIVFFSFLRLRFVLLYMISESSLGFIQMEGWLSVD
jgi:hypothetical protein